MGSTPAPAAIQLQKLLPAMPGNPTGRRVVRTGRSFALNRSPAPVTDAFVPANVAPCTIQKASVATQLRVRSHNFIPSHDKVGGVYWAAWNASNTTVGGPDGDAESVGSFIVVAKSTDGINYSEQFYITPTNAATISTIKDPYVFAEDGQIHLLVPILGNGEAWDGQGGTWHVAIRNPEASAVICWSRWTRLCDGYPGFPFKVGGRTWLTIPYWRHLRCLKPTRAGKHLFEVSDLTALQGPSLRLVTTLPDPDPNGASGGTPRSAPPVDANLFSPYNLYNGYDETTVAETGDGTLFAVFRGNANLYTTRGTVQADGTISWTLPQAFIAPDGTAAGSRPHLTVSPSGRLALVYHQLGRVKLTICFSDDGGLTWPKFKVLDTENTTYPCLRWNGDEFSVSYDTNRNNRADFVDQIRMAVGSEADVWTNGTGASITTRVLYTRSWNHELEDVISQMTVKPSYARALLMNALIDAIKAADAWVRLNGLWVQAAHDAQAARVDWISPGGTKCIAQNSPIFTADRGYESDGIAAFIDTNRSLATDFPLFQRDDAHFGYFLQAWPTMNGSSPAIGAAVNGIASNPRSNTGSFSAKINATSASQGTTVASPLKHSIINRKGSAGFDQWRDGVNINTATQVSTGVPATNLRLLNSVSVGFASPGNRIAAAHAGGSLTDAQALALYTALNTYMTAVGAA